MQWRLRSDIAVDADTARLEIQDTGGPILSLDALKP